MIGLRELWGGYVRVGVSGRRPERLANLLWNHRVGIWGLDRGEDEEIRFWIAVSDVKVLRRLVRKADCSVRVLEKRGGRFPRQRLWRQKTPLVAAFLFLVVVYAVTGFVWVVEIEGEHSLNQVVLREAMSDLGLWPGAWKRGVDLDKVEKGLLLRFSQLGWVGARMEGTRAVVHLVEKARVDPETVAPGDLVADRNAVIESIMVVSGEALVSAGDTVFRGQTLVATTEDSPAQAVIKGRVWYDAYAEASMVRRDRIYTGERAETWFLQVGDVTYRLRGPQEPPFGEWEKDRHAWQIAPGRNKSAVMELIKLQYYEVYTREEELGVHRTTELALKRAREAALAEIPPEAQVVDLRSQTVHETSQVIGVRVVVEALHEIGRHQEKETDQEG